MQTWNKEQRRTLANTFILAGQLGVLKCLNTRHYLFIFLIEVFDLKVVDAEWCFDLPTKLENILLPRNLIRYQRACYENIHNGCLADTYPLSTAQTPQREVNRFPCPQVKTSWGLLSAFVLTFPLLSFGWSIVYVLGPCLGLLFA